MRKVVIHALLFFVPILLLSCGRVADDPIPHQGIAIQTTISNLHVVDLLPGEKLRVVASTNLIGEVVAAVGGETLELTTILPFGTDPHAYQPTPQDLASVAEAHLVFINGLGLEAFLDEMLANAGGQAQVISISEGITPLSFDVGQGSDHEDDGHDDKDGSLDPHVWLDPQNVIIWARNAAHALGALQPGQAESYMQRAGEYIASLQSLDDWITRQVAPLTPLERKLVTDHHALGYFARRYGFEIIGAVIPAYSTAAEPSAMELAALQELVSASGIKAIFVGTHASTGIADRLAEDTGVLVVSLYTGSLSQPGGPAETYRDLMEYNVSAIVDALRP